ncbi:hypothetical protein [Bacillus pumilus]|uniref:hypothetical protein n=1 Tax=Bacillus pumilus TaxID=1408 RepID=UPI00119F2AA4|nr:hypothetical protein [Bacillus pumilus]
MNIDVIKENILSDEKEYCFDRTYTSDECWSKMYPNQTRLQAFRKVYRYVNSASLSELLNCYGDKYNHLFTKEKGEVYVD